MLEIWASQYYLGLFIFLFGLAVGSFLNVCIYRIPLPDVSIHSPRRSFCPECNETIKVHDNIPILSYLILWGKCRYCKARISVIYPLVELATGALFLFMFYHFGLTLEFLLALVFITVLLPISVIDVRYYIIPNVIIATGLILGVVIVCAIAYQRADVWYLLTRLIGAVTGGMALWLIAVIGSAILRKKAMGGGDIKLMALIGLFLGAWSPTRDGDSFLCPKWCDCRECFDSLWTEKSAESYPVWSLPCWCRCACAFMGR